MSQQAAGLCRWLSTFPGIHVEALDELADGSVLHHVLHAIYPNDTAEPAPLDPLLQSSSPAKKSKREDDGDEEEQDEAAYAGRFNSLKRLVADMIRCSNDDNLQTFISQVKLYAIAKDGRPDEIQKLVMALVACAVQSEDQDKFVQRIMHLDGDSQRVLKDCIEMFQGESETSAVPMTLRQQGELVPPMMPKASSSTPSNGTPSLTTVSSTEPSASLHDGSGARASPVHAHGHAKVSAAELDNLRASLQALQHSYDELSSEKTALELQLANHHPNSSSSLPDGSSGRSDNLLRLEAKRLQDEVERLSLEVVALKDNDIKKDLKLSTLTRQLEKHQESTKQVQTMRDQIDELQNEAVRLRKFETVYGQLKKKLETLEMVELRLKESEERNAALSEDVGKLEKEAAEVSVLRTQLKMAEMRNSMITKELEQTQAERDQLRSAAVPASPVQSRHRRTPSSVSVASNSSGSAPAGHSRVPSMIVADDEDSDAPVPLSKELFSNENISKLNQTITSLEKENAQLRSQLLELELDKSLAAPGPAPAAHAESKQPTSPQSTNQPAIVTELPTPKPSELVLETDVKPDEDTSTSSLSTPTTAKVAPSPRTPQAFAQELFELQQKLDEALLVNAELEKKLEEQTTHENERQAKWNSDREVTFREKQALQKDLEESESACESAKAEAEAARKESKKLKATTAQAETENQELQEELAIKKDEIDALEKRLSTRKEELAQLRLVNTTLQGEMDAFSLTHENLKTTLLTTQVELRRLQEQASVQAAAAAAAPVPVVVAPDTSRLELALAERTAQATHAEELMLEKSGELARVQLELRELQVKLVEMEAQVSRRTGEAESLRTERQSLQDQIKQQEIQLQQLPAAVPKESEESKQYTEELEAKLDKTFDQIRTLKRSNTTLTENMIALQDERDRIEIELKRVQQQRDDLKAKLDALVAKSRHDDLDYTARKEDLDRREKDLQQLKLQLSSTNTGHFSQIQEMVDQVFAEKTQLHRTLLEEKEAKFQLEKQLRDEIETLRRQQAAAAAPPKVTESPRVDRSDSMGAPTTPTSKRKEVGGGLLSMFPTRRGTLSESSRPRTSTVATDNTSSSVSSSFSAHSDASSIRHSIMAETASARNSETTSVSESPLKAAAMRNRSNTLQAGSERRVIDLFDLLEEASSRTLDNQSYTKKEEEEEVLPETPVSIDEPEVEKKKGGASGLVRKLTKRLSLHRNSPSKSSSKQNGDDLAGPAD